MIQRYIRPKNVFWILIILALFRGLLYAIAVPPWQHPDEPTHFEHLRFIAETGRIPTVEDFSVPIRFEIAYSMEKAGFWDPDPPPDITEQALASAGISYLGIYTFTHPRLYYILAGFWLKPWLGLSVEGQLLAVRFFSVILSLVIITTTNFSVRLIFPKREWFPQAVMAFIVFLPGYTDIMSAANNDALANTLGALFFLAAVMLISRGSTFRSYVVLGLAIVLLIVIGFFTKTTTLLFIMSVPILIIINLFGKGHTLSALIIIMVALLLVATVLILVQIESLDSFEQAVITRFSRWLRVNIPNMLKSTSEPEYIGRAPQTIPVIFRGFWGTFGWGHILFSPIVYWVLAGITIVAGAGLLRILYQWLIHKSERISNGIHKSIIGFSITFGFLAWLNAVARGLSIQWKVYLSQGRYTFIAIVPLALLFVYGISTWIPESMRKGAALVFGLALIIFDAIAFWGYLVPAYY